MDTFTEPYPSAAEGLPLPKVREHVRLLEQQHTARGQPLSGRIVHVCHYLPLVPSLRRQPASPAEHGVLSPPPTPPTSHPDVPPSPSAEVPPPAPSQTDAGATWKLAPRYGHAAMFSGIRSLGATHEQLIVGWTGDIALAAPSSSSPAPPDAPRPPGDGAPASPNHDEQAMDDDASRRVSSADVTQDERRALEDALRAHAAGEERREGSEDGRPVHTLTYAPVWLDDKVAHGHYDGYSKQTLWPLFHYLLWQDVATEYASADQYWSPYEQANQVFADRLLEVLRPGDLVWVHDYHLLLVPKMIREAKPDALIGLFVHTPFPSSEIFRCLPRRREILDGMLGANLVCFQTYAYSRHFISTCVRVCGYETAVSHGPSSSASARSRRHSPDGSRSRISSPMLRSASLAPGGPASASGSTTSVALGSHSPRPGMRRSDTNTSLASVGAGRSAAASPARGAQRAGRAMNGASREVGIDVQGHVALVSHCAVGIDAERVARDILRPGVLPKLEALRALYADKKIIVGRDKLDVVKGVLQKLRAFEKLLQDYPEWLGKVVLIQVTSPALTDSPKLERQVSELVAHINGEYGSLDFIPVHHYHQTLKKDEFYALLSVADLGVITPLRDGMNTTSMEFVIAQQRTKRSPLVLSEFMGISQHMAEALQVNPWDIDGVAAAMNRGLLMDAAEKEARHAALHRVVATHTSHTWAALLAKMLLARTSGQNTARMTPFVPKEHLEAHYARAKKRLFLFDYDGTLTPIVKTPSMAVPSEDALTALARLTADERNIVYIVSGRDQEFLEQHLGHFARLGMSAEHGGFIREPGAARQWVNFTESLDMSWMEEVAEIFRYYTERTTGSHIEMKKSSITWHYRGADPEWGQFQCRQCQDLLENNLAHKRPIEVLVGKKNLEVRPLAVNKGEIVKRILYKNPDAEFIFCAGDDKTDEDMFRALHLFPPGTEPGEKATMEAPLSVTLVEPPPAHDEDDEEEEPDTTVELAVAREAVFTTAVGHSSKRTLASWHVTTPEEVIEHMLFLVGEMPSRARTPPAGAVDGEIEVPTTPVPEGRVPAAVAAAAAAAASAEAEGSQAKKEGEAAGKEKEKEKSNLQAALAGPGADVGAKEPGILEVVWGVMNK